MDRAGICPLCKRELDLVPHHFIPSSLHKDNWYKKRYTEEQLNMHADVCVDCHNAIHKFHDNKELADNINTLDKILEDDKIMKFAKFAAKQKGSIGTRTKKSRDSIF